MRDSIKVADCLQLLSGSESGAIAVVDEQRRLVAQVSASVLQALAQPDAAQWLLLPLREALSRSTDAAASKVFCC